MSEAMKVDTVYQKNANVQDPVLGAAVVAMILAVAAARADLRHAVVSFQFDAERGVGILVRDAGHRQHLANALRFERHITEFWIRTQGTGYSREGVIEGIAVRIWNLEP